MANSPLVSVMMAAYNAEKFIQPSIDSVLNQTYENWELIVLNDGSTDATESIVKQIPDRRIKYFENDGNMGLVYTRNKMIDLCTGKYAAVLDSDDIAAPDRIRSAVEFLEQNPAYALVGGGMDIIDQFGTLTGESYKFDAKPGHIPAILFFNNYFIHSTVVMKTDVLKSLRYREFFAPAEDYDLWVRISKKAKVFNFKEILVQYRIHPSNTSVLTRERQLIAEKAILLESYRALLPDLPDADEQLIYNFSYGRSDGIPAEEVSRYARLAENLAAANKVKKEFPAVFFGREVLSRWLRLCKAYKRKNIRIALEILFMPNFSIITKLRVLSQAFFFLTRRFFSNRIKSLLGKTGNGP